VSSRTEAFLSQGMKRDKVNAMHEKVFNIKKNKLLRAELRNNQTEPEQRLWHRLRANQLGVKFRRQHGIGSYIVDFYCPERKLVVEVDGDSHFTAEAEEYDQIRDRYMQQLGLTVLRFTNQQVIQQLDDVVTKIYNATQIPSV
jgi:very-short-patch-repair endonuclease